MNLTLFSKLNGQVEELDREAFLKIATERIDQLDVSSAIEDVIHFIRDQEAITRNGSKEFFLHWIQEIQTTSDKNRF